MNIRRAFLTLVALSLPVSAIAQSSDLHGKVAFVSLTTAKVVKAGEPREDFAPKVLLRFTKRGGSSGFLAMTGNDGTAVIPVEPGEYCVDAFGLDGRRAKLAEHPANQSHGCFTAIAGKMVEFSVNLAADAVYAGNVPSLGIE
jgi:hypothetical protein